MISFFFNGLLGGTFHIFGNNINQIAEQLKMPYIFGRNAVMEALNATDTIQKIFVQFGTGNDKVSLLYKTAKSKGVQIVTADPRKLAQMVGKATHQGVVALISPVEVIPLETYLSEDHSTRERLLLILDRIQDPHNLGAIIRSAEIFGASGLVYSARDSVAITDTVIKASSGAVFHLPLYRSDNLSRAVRLLSDDGFRILGAMPDENAASLWKQDFQGDCAIVIGGEGSGIREGLGKQCDSLFYIPQQGKTQSLNASVAAAVVLAEIARQRESGSAKQT